VISARATSPPFRQRVAAAPLLDIFEPPLRQPGLDREAAAGIDNPRRRAFDDGLGIVEVALFAARTEGGPPLATIS
jgi:hypothetical protein